MTTATKMLRLLGVLDLVGVSRSTWLDWVRRGIAPAPVRLGPRAVAWRSDSIEDFINSRQSARNDAGEVAA